MDGVKEIGTDTGHTGISQVAKAKPPQRLAGRRRACLACERRGYRLVHVFDAETNEQRRGHFVCEMCDGTAVIVVEELP